MNIWMKEQLPQRGIIKKHEKSNNRREAVEKLDHPHPEMPEHGLTV